MSTRLFFFAAATTLVLVIFLAASALGQAGYTSQIRSVDKQAAHVRNYISDLRLKKDLAGVVQMLQRPRTSRSRSR
jgi:hypothetical protein